MADRLSTAHMLTAAGRAITKIDEAGHRGASYVTYAEIEAMATTLAALGCPAIAPGQTIEDPCFVSTSFHPSNFIALVRAARKEPFNE
ncbi:MAG: hypothetical protein ACPH5G_03555 [Pseudooceanicola atlanticus]